MERITDPVFRNEYGECEKERLKKRMERIKEIENHLINFKQKELVADGIHDNAPLLNAIYDIEYLLAENKRLREEIDSANRVSIASLEQVISSGTELLMKEEVARNIAKFERIKEEHKRYKEALEFYADRDNWIGYDESNVARDGGELAKSALKQE